MSSSAMCSVIKSCLECITLCFFIERPTGETECVIEINGPTVNTVAPDGEDLCRLLYPVHPVFLPGSLSSVSHYDIHNVLWLIAYALYSLLGFVAIYSAKQLWKRFRARNVAHNISPIRWIQHRRSRSRSCSVAPSNLDISGISNEGSTYYHSMEEFLNSLNDSSVTEMTIVPNNPLTPDRIDIAQIDEDGAIMARTATFASAYFGNENQDQNSPIRAAAPGIHIPLNNEERRRKIRRRLFTFDPTTNQYIYQ